MSAACLVCATGAGGDNGHAQCHRCPALEGAVLPGCAGTAVFGRTPGDLSYCTCERSRLALPAMSGDELARAMGKLERALDRPLTSDERNIFSLGAHAAMDVMRERRPPGSTPDATAPCGGEGA